MKKAVLAILLISIAAVGLARSLPHGTRAQDSAGPPGQGNVVGAFESDRFGNSDVFLLRGGQTIRVTHEAAQQGQPAFGCDDHTMYVVSSQNGMLDIWRATASLPWDQFTEGNDVQYDPLTSGPAHLDSHPYAYCRQTPYVFYTHSPFSGNGEVWRMDLDGTNPINLTNNAAEDGAAFPFTASDGSPKLVFTSDRDGDYDIYSMDMDGGDVQQLTDDPAYDASPSVGVDPQGGRHLFFESDRSGNSEIYTIELDASGSSISGPGAQPTRLTNDPDYDNYDPNPCCSDLEERVAELEATTARKGNQPGAHFTIHGFTLAGSYPAPIVEEDTSNNSAPSWRVFELLLPPPTETPFEIPTPTPQSVTVTIKKENADTGENIDRWPISVFEGPTCAGQEYLSGTTGDFGGFFIHLPRGGDWSIREGLSPDYWEPVTPVCQTIDTDLGDQTVIFRNGLVHRRGDSNGDLVISAIDAALDLQFVAGFIPSLPPTADANGDGHVTSVDATLKLQDVAGLYEIPVM